MAWFPYFFLRWSNMVCTTWILCEGDFDRLMAILPKSKIVAFQLCCNNRKEKPTKFTPQQLNKPSLLLKSPLVVKPVSPLGSFVSWIFFVATSWGIMKTQKNKLCKSYSCKFFKVISYWNVFIDMSLFGFDLNILHLLKHQGM